MSALRSALRSAAGREHDVLLAEFDAVCAEHPSPLDRESAWQTRVQRWQRALGWPGPDPVAWPPEDRLRQLRKIVNGREAA